MKKLLFALLSVLILTSSCGKQGKLRLPQKEQVETKKEQSK